jgi:hypothetical protein
MYGRRKLRRRDHTFMAFSAAGIFALAVLAVVEDTLFFATGEVFWRTWKIHAPSIFAGVVAFVLLLYLLQRMNDRQHALDYVQPYLPLLLVSAINTEWKPGTPWVLLTLGVSICWSVLQVRKLRSRRATARRI